MLHRLKKLSQVLPLLAISLLNNNEANAKNEVFNADSKVSEVVMSKQEQNLLEIKGRRISSVIPSVAGVLAYQQDTTNGILYFSLANDNYMGTVTLFVNDDEGGRYRLILVPTNQPAQEITIVPTTDSKSNTNKDDSNQEQENLNGSYVYEIKRAMFNLARAANGIDVSEDMTRIAVNKDIPLWKEAKLTLLNRYDSGNLMGEEYQLTNVTNSVLQVREQEFYRNNVLAVSLTKLSLEPNESAFVYVVRGK